MAHNNRVKIQHDPQEVRVAILYEAAKKKPIFEAYLHFCKMMGDNNIKYPDFEFWFQRFSSGNFDLDHDRSMDPKYRTLSEMPIHVMEIIVERLNWVEQRILRKVCRSLRDFIDEKGCCNFKEMEIKFDHYETDLNFGNQGVTYLDNQRVGVFLKFERKHYDKKTNRAYYKNLLKCVEGEDRVTLPLIDMASVLINPRLQLETLKVDIQMEYSSGKVRGKAEKEAIGKIYYKMKEALKTFEHKIHVKKLELKVENEDQVMAILPFFKPGALEEIELEYVNKLGYRYPRPNEDDELVTDIGLNQLFESDQWKQAKILKMKRLKIASRDIIERLLHFNRFEILLSDRVRIKPEEVLRWKDAFLTAPNFEYCHLESSRRDLYVDGIKKEMGPPYQYPCPGHTNKFLKFDIDKRSMKFEVVNE